MVARIYVYIPIYPPHISVYIPCVSRGVRALTWEGFTHLPLPVVPPADQVAKYTRKRSFSTNLCFARTQRVFLKIPIVLYIYSRARDLPHMERLYAGQSMTFFYYGKEYVTFL